MPFGFAKGAFGVSTNGIYKFLTANDLENERFDNPSSSDEIIKKSEFSIMRYRWYADNLNPLDFGDHYITIKWNGSLFEVYNIYGSDSRAKMFHSIDAWVKKSGHKVQSVITIK